MTLTPSRQEVTFLPGFFALDVLWTGEDAAFPSQQSARWFIRQNRAQLVEARALALLRGRLMFHRERFCAVLESSAIDAAAKRHRLLADGEQ